MSDNQNRKLVAILFADIVGYTSQMQKNEKQANQSLAKFHNTLNEKVNNFKGQVINNYGDGCLCTFESAVDAMRCAIEIQSIFQTEPKVPVRLGLHSGDVYFKENNVYGDSVNVASRIESLGVAGAVLFSKRIKRHISNHEEFTVQSLGEFDFKNVEKTMEVFALANKGFAIPKREDMKGKLKSKKSSNRLIYALLGLLIIAFAGFWFLKKENGMQLGEKFPNTSTPLSKEIRQKRVAVLVFENRTQSENLEDFGIMISDWVTKGLMETGEANVISAANIQTQIKQAGVASSEFSKSTGVGVMLQGRYYLQEDQLIIHANIVDAEKGEVIHALDPIQGHRDKMLDLLDELTQKVLGYWAVKKQKRYLQNPPKYEAYQKLIAVDKIWGDRDHIEKIEQLLQEAFQLDTSFFAPLLKLAVFYNNPGSRSRPKRDSVYQLIEKLKPNLTQWEKLRLEAIKTSALNDYLKAAQLNEQMYLMDHSDHTANYNASYKYLQANMPQKALEILRDLDKRFIDLEEDFSWREMRWAEAYYMLGEYDKVKEVAKQYPYPKMMQRMAYFHLMTLVEMDSLEALTKAYDEYLKMKTYNAAGREQQADDLLEGICDAAYLHNKDKILTEYVTRFKDWTEENTEKEDYLPNMAYAAFIQGDIKTALSLWEEEVKFNPKGKRSWRYMNRIGQIGVCHALLGYIEKAEAEITKLDAVEANYNPAVHTYNKAKIQAALGRLDEAVSSLKLAEENGITYYPWRFGKVDIFMKPLFGYPAFEELVKPKG